jgi:GH25 family lysozyme M1 (1,4-beta-N-acetylmuramidase)
VEYNAGCGHDDDLLLNPSEWARRLKMMLEALKHNLQSDVIIYSSAGMIRQYVDPTGDELWLRDYGLWCANWGVPTPLLPKPFLGYIFHQYGIGLIDGARVDFNRYNGDNVFDYAQMIYIGRTKKINGEIEDAREAQRARYEKITNLFNAGKVGEAENEIKKGEVK